MNLHQKLDWLRDVPDDALHLYLTPDELAQLKREQTDFSAYEHAEVVTISVTEPITETDPDSYAADEVRRRRAELLGEL